jgi:hypothetical protein
MIQLQILLNKVFQTLHLGWGFIGMFAVISSTFGDDDFRVGLLWVAWGYP